MTTTEAKVLSWEELCDVVGCTTYLAALGGEGRIVKLLGLATGVTQGGVLLSLQYRAMRLVVRCDRFGRLDKKDQLIDPSRFECELGIPDGTPLPLQSESGEITFTIRDIRFTVKPPSVLRGR